MSSKLEMNKDRALIRLTSCLLAGLSPCLLPWQSAHAQAVVGASPHASGSAATESTAEIVVTANKRSENINKVGSAITAFSSADLQERRIVSLADLAAATPGLSFTSSFTNTPIYTLRGVGFNEASLGVYPAVSVYIDQIPLPFPVMATHAAFDLERVEVLKGPQGTLFGENSTGGAVNYIAAKPTKTFEGGAELSYGRFDQVDGTAHISGPINDQLAFRLAITGLQSDDWQHSYTRNASLGKQAYVAGRAILDFKPTDSMRFSLSFNAWNDTSDPQAVQLVAVKPQFPAYARPQVENYPYAPNDPQAADWTCGPSPTGAGGAVNAFCPHSDRSYYQAGLRGDVDLPGNLTLTSLTSYADFSQRQSVDYDGLSLILEDAPKISGALHSFNQEVRLANSSASKVRWILGANFENSVTKDDFVNGFGDSSSSNPIELNIITAGVLTKQNITNWAVFGDADYKILDNVTLKGGVRYTSSRDVDSTCGYVPPGGELTATLFNILGTLFGTAPFNPIGIGGCYTLNNNGVPGQIYRNTLAENNVSWRVGIDYQVSSDTLLYANISRGFKAGSFPTLPAATFGPLAPVTQEEITAYEAGVKGNYLDHKLQLTAAIFDYDYDNKQVRGKLLDPSFGVLDALVNVPKSQIWGAETQVTVRPVSGLSLTAAATYLESKIKSYTGFDAQGVVMNFAGDRLPYTPRWAELVDGEYRFNLDTGGQPFIGVTAHFQSDSDSVLGSQHITIPVDPGVNSVKPGVTNPYVLPSWATLDLRAGYKSQSGAWQVEVWGKNVTNEYVVDSVITASDTVNRLLGRPATYGITFSNQF